MALVSSNTRNDPWFNLAIDIAAANHVPIIFIVRGGSLVPVESLFSDDTYQQVVKVGSITLHGDKAVISS